MVNLAPVYLCTLLRARGRNRAQLMVGMITETRGIVCPQRSRDQAGRERRSRQSRNSPAGISPEGAGIRLMPIAL